jgi:4-methoxybenzoate monooxygenase (O-demethylating)
MEIPSAMSPPQRWTGPCSDLDPFDEAFLADPYPQHAQLRDAGPVVRLDRYGIYAMARHQEVAAALNDWQTYSSARGVGIQDFATEPPWRPKSIVLETDPPLHDRTRRILQRVMSPAAMRALRPQFRAKAVALVDHLVARRDIDAVTDLAEAFPLSVMPDAVGLRPDGRENLLPYSTMVFNSFGPKNELFRQSTAAAEPVLAWIHAQCAREALAPGGFGAEIWAAHDAGEISSDEAQILVRSILTAGLDTTVNGFSNAIYAFATNAGEWQKLRADRALLKPAFDEVIRWESPVQTFFRTTTRDVRIENDVIPEGSKVLLFLGAANRDPRRWEAPERFDVSRKPIGHTALGVGIHACVGQLVARLEADVLFEALADRVERVEISATPERALNNTLRSFRRMPVRLTPAVASSVSGA